MFLDIDGYKINYKVSGDGDENVIILQGWAAPLEIYDSLAEKLSSKYTVHQFDLPGFGKSNEPKEPWCVDDYVAFFEKFLDEIKVEKATLIGHSYGGRIIIKFASRLREENCARTDNSTTADESTRANTSNFQIDRIVLIDSAGIIPRRSFLQKCKVAKYKVLKSLLTNKPVHWLFDEVIDYWQSQQGSEDYKNASPVMKKTLVKSVNEDLSDLLQNIEYDTLLIWGENDTATPIRDAKIMEANIPNAGLAVIKNAGHYPFLEQPHIFDSVFSKYFEIDRSAKQESPGK